MSIDARDAAIAFLYSRIDYERALAAPYSERRLKLARMRELLARLGNPQDRLPIVHVAGSKGKGSVAAMIAAMLSAAGYRTGLYCSPHLHAVEERFVCDGAPCTSREFVELVELVRPAIVAMDAATGGQPYETGPTYFEMTTAMALVHFVRRGAAACVLEVGMGGRLDSTNVCLPRVAVITSISFDHVQQLGRTLASIAREKAGIIKPGVPVVSGVLDDEPRNVIEEIAHERRSPVVQLGREFTFTHQPPEPQWCGGVDPRSLGGRLDFYDTRHGHSAPALDGVKVGLLGRHQAANAAVALATIEELLVAGWEIPPEARRRGLAQLEWPARVEVVSTRPTIIVDAAHNVASIEALLATLDECFRAPRRLLIFATTREKDVDGMLAQLLPRFQHVYFTRYTSNPRGVPVEELVAIAQRYRHENFTCLADPASAWAAAARSLGAESLLCVTGSFFIAAELRSLILEQQNSNSRNS